MSFVNSVSATKTAQVMSKIDTTGDGVSIAGELDATAIGTNLNEVLTQSFAPQTTTYTKTAVDSAISSADYAPQSTTYTKTEVDSAITSADFAPQSTTYTKTEVDSAISSADFAPQSTTYTKTEVDSAISSAGGGATVDDIYPVGSVKIMYSAWSGFSGQTWVLFGSGKTLVGQDTNDPDFNTLLETGGSKTHTLTIAQIPSHQHQININKYGSDDLGIWTHPNPKAANGNSNQMKEYDMIGRSVATGSGQSHPIVQPYQVVLYYRRTA